MYYDAIVMLFSSTTSSSTVLLRKETRVNLFDFFCTHLVIRKRIGEGVEEHDNGIIMLTKH